MKALTTREARTKALAYVAAVASQLFEEEAWWGMIDDVGGEESANGRRMLRGAKWAVEHIQLEVARRRSSGHSGEGDKRE